MKVKNQLFCLFISILLVGCIGELRHIGKKLYPINSKLIKFEGSPKDHIFNIAIDYKNMFHHQILEYSDFMIDESGSSDLATRIFIQFDNNSRDTLENLSNCRVVEETYMYLDSISQHDTLTGLPSSGQALYFITLPMVTEERQKYYFEDSLFIKMSGIRTIYLGEWQLKKNELTLIFPDSGNKIWAMKANYHNKIIDVHSVTHPSGIKQKNENIDVTDVIKRMNFINVSETIDFTSSDEESYITFNPIDSNRVLIHDHRDTVIRKVKTDQLIKHQKDSICIAKDLDLYEKDTITCIQANKLVKEISLLEIIDAKAPIRLVFRTESAILNKCCHNIPDTLKTYFHEFETGHFRKLKTK